MLIGLVQEMRRGTGGQRHNVRFHTPRDSVEIEVVDKEAALIEAGWAGTPEHRNSMERSPSSSPSNLLQYG
jgi:hypothetical protein